MGFFPLSDTASDAHANAKKKKNNFPYPLSSILLFAIQQAHLTATLIHCLLQLHAGLTFTAILLKVIFPLDILTE